MEEDELVIFRPTKNDGAKGGFTHLPELDVKVKKDDTNQNIILALNQALGVCE